MDDTNGKSVMETLSGKMLKLLGLEDRFETIATGSPCRISCYATKVANKVTQDESSQTSMSTSDEEQSSPEARPSLAKQKS